MLAVSIGVKAALYEELPVIDRIKDRGKIMKPIASSAAELAFMRLAGLPGLFLNDRGLRLNGP